MCYVRQKHILNTIWMNFMFQRVCKLQISGTSLVSTRRQTSNGLIRSALDSSAARNYTVWGLHATDTDGTVTALAEMCVFLWSTQGRYIKLSLCMFNHTLKFYFTSWGTVSLCHTSRKGVVHSTHERVLNWPSWNEQEQYVNTTFVRTRLSQFNKWV